MDYQNVLNYLEGKTGETESEQIRQWLNTKENESRIREILEEIWNNNQIRLKGQKPNFELLLSQVHHRINREIPDSNIQLSYKQLITSNWYQLFTKVAAILVIPLLALTAYLLINQKESLVTSQTVASAISPTREIYTKPGTRTKIELSDGTMVWLNDGTIFRYPEQFTQNNRQVFVDGQAYFEVKSNPKSPFIINNPMMTTTVTGTHFNLNAYSKDGFFEATLLEGKIELSRKDGKNNLIPGERVQFDTITNKWQKNYDMNTLASTAWINGKLIIQNERLGVAIKKISRWYNVEMVLRDPDLNNLLITGTFENEKLDQTLKLIALAIPVKFTYKKEADALKIQRTIFMDKR